MSYREAPRQLAVVCMGSAAVALDVDDGTIVWTYRTPSSIVRLFRVGPRVMLVCGSEVHCVEHETGRPIGRLEIGFRPESGCVVGSDLLLVNGQVSSGQPCAIRLTSEGALRWHVAKDTKSKGLLDGDTVLRSYGLDGAQRSEAHFDGFVGGRAGLLVGDTTVQPDEA